MPDQGESESHYEKAKALKEKYAEYLPGIRRRWQAEQAVHEARRAEAWKAARDVAEFLRGRYGAGQVIAFGSLVHSGRFTEDSDIDLAVSGIAAGSFFQAWGAALFACSFDLDMIDLAYCSPGLKAVIEQEGVAL